MFRVLSSICFLRFQWCHFNKPWSPTWTRGDVLLHQQSDEMIGMLEAVLEHGGTRIEQELAEAHRAAAPPMPPPRKKTQDHQPCNRCGFGHLISSDDPQTVA